MTRCSCPSDPGPASRCRGCSTRCSTSASTTNRCSGWHASPTTSASPGTRTGASCRCSATSRAGSRASDSRTRSRHAKSARGVTEDTDLDVEALARAHGDLQVDLPRPHRRGLPAGPDRAAAARDPGRVRLVARRARRLLPASEPDPRRLGHGRQRAADGVRQQGRHLGFGRRLLARRGDRRARAERRFSPQRPGRGRRLRRAHTARHLRDGAVAARRPRPADGDPADARAPLRGHAGHGVHGRGGAAVHAPDPQRQAPGPGRRAVRGRRGLGGAADPRAGADDDRPRRARRAPAPDVRPRGGLRRACERASTHRPAPPRGRSCSPPPTRWRPPTRAAT